MSGALLLILAPTAPLIAAALAAVAPAWLARFALIAAAAPGVLAGLSAGGATLAAPGMLFGMRLGLDADLAPAMAAVAAVWGFAALHGVARRADTPAARRYALCFALAMAGQMGVFVARDLATFYAAFACLSFAGYGLVAQAGSPAAFRAARVYLGFVVAGELALFAGFVLISHAQGGDLALPVDGGVAPPALAWWLLAAGFGAKAGIVPLHAWLPLAHPVAPPAASAALSGGTLKAGLLGLMALAPLSTAAPQGFGAAMLALGLLGAFGGAALAALQKEVKTALAWSSVSQMGLAAALYGGAHAGLVDPALAAGALAAFIAAHALAKAALFLSVASGVSQWVAVVLAASPALSLTGAPLTLGYGAKAAAGAAIADATLALAFDLAAYGTALAMARVLVLTARRGEAGRPDAVHAAAFATLALAVAAAPLVAPEGAPTDAAGLTKAMAPALFAAVVAGLALSARLAPPRWASADPMTPFAPLSAALSAAGGGAGRLIRAVLDAEAAASASLTDAGRRVARAPRGRVERRTWRDAALAMAAVGGALLWASV